MFLHESDRLAISIDKISTGIQESAEIVHQHEQELHAHWKECELIFPDGIPDPFSPNYNICEETGFVHWLDEMNRLVTKQKIILSALKYGVSEIRVQSIVAEFGKIVENLIKEDLEALRINQFNLKYAKSEQIKYETQRDELTQKFKNEQAWWEKFTAHPPATLAAYNFRKFIEDENEYRSFKIEAKNWQVDLEECREFLDEYQDYVLEWADRIDRRDAQDVAELRQIYFDNANVIGITCGQSGGKKFSEEFRNFDCVIVDEVSKATPPELVLPLLKGKKVVLVGDHKQLPPMVGHNTLTELAEEMQTNPEKLAFMRRALFQELFEQSPEELRTMLKIQYRMHPQIMDAINQFYENRLECGLTFPDQKRNHGLSQIIEADKHILWIDFPIHEHFHEQREQGGTSFYNQAELDVIEKLINRIDEIWEVKVKAGVDKKSIGLITFYAAQSKRLQKLLDKQSEQDAYKNLQLRIGTVDKFQGMERPIIITSLVRNNGAGQIGFAKEPERINVAFSRAQELLIIIGCGTLFTQEAKGNYGSATRFYKQVYTIAQREGMVIPASQIL